MKNVKEFKLFKRIGYNKNCQEVKNVKHSKESSKANGDCNGNFTSSITVYIIFIC